jgi:hypothetical protein
MGTLKSTRGSSLLLHRNIALPRARTAAPAIGEYTFPGGLVTNEGRDEAHPDGIPLDSVSIQHEIENALTGKFNDTFAIRLGDAQYYLPTVEEFGQIVSATSTDRRKWIQDKYDCDDFAYVLKAFTSSVAYFNNNLVYGLSTGIIWGRFSWVSEFHACNWFLDNLRTFRLIEPQDGRIFTAQECLGSVTFIAA